MSLDRLETGLRVFVDARIPHAVEVFSCLGPVATFDGHDARFDPGPLRGAQVLITRSVTPIGPPLLEAMPDLVAVASPTVGTDHVDFAALEEHRHRTGRAIPFFHAPGATSGGVADFTLAAILLAARHLGADPRSWRVGIWGCGNCGSALAGRLDRIGIPWVAHDPPRSERDGFPSAPLDEVLDCDVVTLHVPLTTSSQSRWPTRHMVSNSVLRRIAERTRVLINTSRGAVVDSEALARVLVSGAPLLACLDVWEGEPTPPPNLVSTCFLATPHSAGSVIEGRLRAVRSVLDALRASIAPWAPPPPACLDAVSPAGPFRLPDDLDAFLDAVGLEVLALEFRKRYLDAPPEGRREVFDRMRVERTRHEVVWEGLDTAHPNPPPGSVGPTRAPPERRPWGLP